jgi:exopolysaccharide biosynthesis polyprenyl glycosylphosphotransferase
MYQQQVAQPVAGAEEDDRFYSVCKRVFDVAFSIIALILALPLLLIVALWVGLDSGRPILFRQTRVGKGGRPFTFYKFRTMYHNADPEIHRRYVQSLIRQQVETAAVSEGQRQDQGQEGGFFKLAKDPRITRVGIFLRRTSLDELPQFFNVLKGDMSLVGPRPPLPYEVQEYQDWHLARLQVLPGITGLWQVRGRSRVTFDEMVRMDIDYIHQRSLWLDLKILILTVPAVLAGHGAV